MASLIFGKEEAQQPNGATPGQADDAPWMISTAARAMGTIAGIFSILFGFISLFSIFDTTCIVAGALLIIEGLVISLIEAPCFCTFLDFAYTPSGLLKGKPHWIKGTLYLLFAAIPFFWCFGFSVIIGCFLIFMTSALYLLIALGKKASAEEMRVKATNLSTSPTAILVTNEELPKSSLPPTMNPPSFSQTQSFASTIPKPVY